MGRVDIIFEEVVRVDKRLVSSIFEVFVRFSFFCVEGCGMWVFVIWKVKELVNIINLFFIVWGNI